MATWYLTRKLRKSLGLSRAQWKELEMSPFPKWMGYLGAIAAAAPTLYTAYHQGGIKALIFALISLAGAGTALNAHSASGTGGK